MSASLSHGVVEDLVIMSEKGRPCVVQNPWPGHPVELIRPGKPTQTLEGEHLNFSTDVGGSIELVPAEMPAGA